MLIVHFWNVVKYMDYCATLSGIPLLPLNKVMLVQCFAIEGQQSSPQSSAVIRCDRLIWQTVKFHTLRIYLVVLLAKAWAFI